MQISCNFEYDQIRLLDTSVYGGYFDEEFSADTVPFFERIFDERI